MRFPYPTRALKPLCGPAPALCLPSGRLGRASAAWWRPFLACLALVSAHTVGTAALLDPSLEAAQAFEQARQALDEQRLDRAELLLERVLMLEPDHAEARVEFALLMARRGQPDTARSLLQGLADDPRTPVSYREQLLALISRINPAPPVARESAALWRLESGLTWSSNPLARTGADEISFTTPDGPIALPLVNKPRQGAVAGFALSRSHADQGVEVMLQAADVAGSQPAARLALWGTWPKALGGPSLQWSAAAQQGFDGARRQTVGLTWSGQAVRGSLYRYAEPELADRGHLLRLEAQTPALIGLQGMAHLERAASSVKPQGAWKAGLTAQATAPGRIRFQLQWTGQRDTYGYSPLLAQGAPRWLSSTQAVAEKTLPLDSGKTLTFRVLTTQRRSNIELFAFREAAFQLQVGKMWR